MANLYVWSGATGTGTGASWVNACTTIKLAITASSAGDTIFVAQDHAESSSSAQVLQFRGLDATPAKCLCVNRAGSVPPVSADLRTTATVTTTGANAIGWTGNVYIYGITFNSGTGANALTMTLAGSGQGNGSYCVFDSCAINMATTTASTLAIGGAQRGSLVVFKNTPFTFGAAGHTLIPQDGTIIWKNTASAINGTVPTILWTPTSGASAYAANVIMDGVDLSAAGSGKTLVGAGDVPANFSLLNCELGASVTVAGTSTSSSGPVVSVQISDSGATGYRQEIYSYEGTLTTETTYVRSNGASDGVTPISWKVVTTANAKYQQPLACFQISKWNTATGSSKTATVEIENGGTTLTNADVWMDVEYLGSASFPIASVATSGTDILSSGSNLPTSSVTWNGSLGSAVKQYLQVSFTPNMVGYVRAIVYVAKASQTLYIDPVITIA